MNERKYKAYLTRRSKWEAIRACQKRGVIGISALRDRMASVGEQLKYLDEKWEKRVLGDRKHFEHKKNGFFALITEAEEIDLGKRPEWEGQRPGQDWVREAYNALLTVIPQMEPAAISASRNCFGGQWKETSERVVGALERLSGAGIEKPLGKLFQVSWDEAMKVDIRVHPQVHQLAMWLVVTMIDVDAYTRMRTYTGGGVRPCDLLGPEDDHGSPVYHPYVTRVRAGAGGKMESAPPDQTPRGVLETIRQHLVCRGIMKERG